MDVCSDQETFIDVVSFHLPSRAATLAGNTVQWKKFVTPCPSEQSVVCSLKFLNRNSSRGRKLAHKIREHFSCYNIRGILDRIIWYLWNTNDRHITGTIVLCKWRLCLNSQQGKLSSIGLLYDPDCTQCPDVISSSGLEVNMEDSSLVME